MMMKADKRFLTDEFRKVLSVGSIIGYIDGLAACVNGYFLSGNTPGQIFQYIASGFVGPQAFSGGLLSILSGVLIHFFIAIVITGFFFFFYRRAFALREYYLLYGVFYGLLVWAVMNWIVIPLSAVPSSDPEAVQVVIGLVIHIVIIGIPISLFASRDLPVPSTTNRSEPVI